MKTSIKSLGSKKLNTGGIRENNVILEGASKYWRVPANPGDLDSMPIIDEFVMHINMY